GATPRIPILSWCVTINAVPFHRSSIHTPPGTLVMVRILPERVTARGFEAAPLPLDVNQISSPAGDQTIPSSVVQPEESFLSWLLSLPSTRITATEPSSSPPGFSWSAKATHLPSGEIFGWLIQLMLSNNTFPMGYSKRQWLFSGT